MLRLGILLLSALTLSAQDAREIVLKSLERESFNPKPPRGYVHTREDVEKQVDATGKVVKTISNLKEVMVVYDQTYEKVFSKDGKPLTGKKELAEQAKFDKEMEKRAHETAEAHTKREAAEKKLDDDDLACRQEFGRIFTFKLAGSDTLKGRPVWVIEADAPPDTPAKCEDNKEARKFHIKLWIDQAEYRWIKLTGDSIAPLTFGKILLRAPAGALHVEFDEERLADGTWVPVRDWSGYDFKLLLVKSVRGEAVSLYTDYRKFQTDSRILEIGDAK